MQNLGERETEKIYIKRHKKEISQSQYWAIII